MYDLKTLSDSEREELRRQLDAQNEAEDPRMVMPDVTRDQVKAWREKFNSAITIAEQTRQKYNGSPDPMSGDDRQKYENAIAVADSMKAQIIAGEKALECVSWAKSARGAGLPMGGNSGREEVKSSDADKWRIAHVKAWRQYIMGQPENNGSRIENNPYVKAFSQMIMADPTGYKAYLTAHIPDEIKAYQIENPAGGGYAAMPQELVQEFITLQKDLVYMRSAGRTFQVPQAESLGVPAVDTDPSDDDWTNELGTGNEETTAAFGKRELRPHPVAKLIKMSKTLLRKVPAAETVLMDRLAYKMGITEEKAFLTGTGANQPLGVFTASAQGIPTTQDVTAATTTAIVGTDLVQTFYNLKAQYRQRGSWIVSRTTVSNMRQLKDSNNNFIWTTALPGQVNLPVTGPGGGLQGTPEFLMGRPISESEYAPSTFTTGLYVAIFGDFSNYWIADALDMNIQTLYELYAATNQMGYILRKETDGLPVKAEAFTRLILK